MRRGTAPLVAVVDDDPSIRTALRRLLASAGYSVETFANGREFLARPAARPPACVVLDVRMTGTSGLDLQRQLAGERRELPIVMITGHGSGELRRQALDAGAIAVLDKPFDDQELLDAVAHALGRAC